MKWPLLTFILLTLTLQAHADARLPNPQTDCMGFLEGKLDGQSPLTTVSKAEGEQLRQLARPTDLINVEERFLNPASVKWLKNEGKKFAQFTMYQFMLRSTVYDAFKMMSQEAEQQGAALRIYSGYRAYEDQCYVFSEKLRTAGQKAKNPEEAQALRDRVFLVSAYPGRSEHQLGTAMDITSPGAGFKIEMSFQDTVEFRWLQENAHRFGFVLSYPQGNDGIEGYHARTGYLYEPWHWRYITPSYATEFVEENRRSGTTLIEFLRAQKNMPPLPRLRPQR